MDGWIDMWVDQWIVGWLKWFNGSMGKCNDWIYGWLGRWVDGSIW